MTASRVQFDRADIDSAIAAARRLKSDRNLYVFATHLGYTIDGRPPPGMQSYVVVYPDGTTETIKPSVGGNPMTPEEIDQVASKVAVKVLDEITPTVLDPAGRGILLHFTEHEIEGAGLVVNEARARASPCDCFTYKGREYCFSKGIIGMISSEENPEQIEEYCKVGKTYEVKPGIKERFETFASAAEEAHKEIEAIPKGERLVPWLTAMGDELEKRGIEV